MHSLLIVDDEPLTREFIQYNISSVDPDWKCVGEAADGAEALKFLESSAVDLVITDIKMPVMDGIELCRQIKARNPRQEIVILSGYDEFSFAQEAMRYQVHGYLLKPIKIPALKETLTEIASILGRSAKDEIALQTMQDLSSDYKKHICSSYIRAIILNSYTEIRALHPMIHKLKIDPVQGEAIILILKLDVGSLLFEKMDPDDISVFYYMLFQIAAEIVDEEKCGYVVLDFEENTVIFLTAENRSELKQKCAEIYEKIASFLTKHTGLTATGYVGSAKSDILEMDSSYSDASQIIPLWVITGDHKLYYSDSVEPSQISRITKLEKDSTAILSNLFERDKAKLYFTVDEYICTIDSPEITCTVSYLLFLVQKIFSARPDFRIDRYIMCLRSVARYISAFRTDEAHINRKSFYVTILQSVFGKPDEPAEKPATNQLVDSAKEYIYQHFTEAITLSQIADSLHVSPNYLSKVFHEAVGESYIKFITRIRMEYAAELLTDSKEHIFAIAEKAGYYNLKHFNFVFKEFYNLTPTEYQSSHLS